MSENKSVENQGTNEEPKRFGDHDAEVTQPGVDLLAQMESLKAEADKAKNDFLYLAADFENFKKGKFKEISEIKKYGSERLLVDLLDVLDVFDKALESEISSNNIESFKKGIELTAQQFRAVLNRFGVTEVPSKGHPFDPGAHEALSSIESDTVPEGHVAEVFKKPYKLHDRVIRPAQVVIAKPKSRS